MLIATISEISIFVYYRSLLIQVVIRICTTSRQMRKELGCAGWFESKTSRALPGIADDQNPALQRCSRCQATHDQHTDIERIPNQPHRCGYPV